MPDFERLREAAQQRVDSLLPKLRATAQLPRRHRAQPTAFVLYIDCYARTEVAWDQFAEVPADVLPGRLDDAIRDLAEMLFQAVEAQLDPEFVMASSPRLREYANALVRRGEEYPS